MRRLIIEYMIWIFLIPIKPATGSGHLFSLALKNALAPSLCDTFKTYQEKLQSYLPTSTDGSKSFPESKWMTELSAFLAQEVEALEDPSLSSTEDLTESGGDISYGQTDTFLTAQSVTTEMFSDLLRSQGSLKRIPVVTAAVRRILIAEHFKRIMNQYGRKFDLEGTSTAISYSVSRHLECGASKVSPIYVPSSGPALLKHAVSYAVFDDWQDHARRVKSSFDVATLDETNVANYTTLLTSLVNALFVVVFEEEFPFFEALCLEENDAIFKKIRALSAMWNKKVECGFFQPESVFETVLQCAYKRIKDD